MWWCHISSTLISSGEVPLLPSQSMLLGGTDRLLGSNSGRVPRIFCHPDHSDELVQEISTEFPFSGVTKLIIKPELQGAPKRRKSPWVWSQSRNSGPRDGKGRILMTWSELLGTAVPECGPSSDQQGSAHTSRSCLSQFELGFCYLQLQES